MRWLSGILLAGGFCFSINNTLASEKTLIFQNGLNGYQGTEDTYLMTGKPNANTNFTNNPDGLKYEFEWDGQDAGGRNIALIRFGNIVGADSHQIPPITPILKAELQTTITNSGTKSQFSTIYNMLIPWKQETATYNNVFVGVPITDDPPIGEYVSQTQVKVMHDPNQVGQTWSADITPLVQEIVDGLHNNGFAIVPDFSSTDGFGHYSSETPLAESAIVLTVETTEGTYTFQEGENGYSGLQDAWIGNRDADYYSNFGNQSMMNLVRSAADNVRVGLLRFDQIIGTEPGEIPANSTILDATLGFWVQEAGTNDVYVSEILPFQKDILGTSINTYFDEKKVTFENFVENGVYPQIGVEIAEVWIAQFKPQAFSRTEIDVTESLKKWVAGTSPNYGWLLEATGSSAISVAAKESVNTMGPPRLVITFETMLTAIPDFMLY